MPTYTFSLYRLFAPAARWLLVGASLLLTACGGVSTEGPETAGGKDDGVSESQDVDNQAEHDRAVALYNQCLNDALMSCRCGGDWSTNSILACQTCIENTCRWTLDYINPVPALPDNQENP